MCKLSATITLHAVQPFCLSVHLCIAGILLRISSCGQSAKSLKRLFFFFLLSPTCAEVKPTVSIPYQSPQTRFFFFPFLISSYLTLQNSMRLSGRKLRLRKAAKFHSWSFDWLHHWTERFMPCLLMLCGCILSMCDPFPQILEPYLSPPPPPPI